MAKRCSQSPGMPLVYRLLFTNCSRIFDVVCSVYSIGPASILPGRGRKDPRDGGGQPRGCLG